jgi:pimeloyl-ACP methyl ester carboxylesterase
VIAHDRRGHGRSGQVSEGNDIDHYADDLAALTEHLDLHDAVHVGPPAGGGEVARYIGRHGETRVAKVALISAVTRSVVPSETNPAGAPGCIRRAEDLAWLPARHANYTRRHDQRRPARVPRILIPR